MASNFRRAYPITPVAEDTDWVLWTARFDIAHTPGHAKGHLSITKPDGVCRAGDAIISKRILAHSKLPYMAYVNESIQSMERIRNIDYRFCIVVHHAVIPRTDIAELVGLNIEKKLHLYDVMRKEASDPIGISGLMAAFMKSIGIAGRAGMKTEVLKKPRRPAFEGLRSWANPGLRMIWSSKSIHPRLRKASDDNKIKCMKKKGNVSKVSIQRFEKEYQQKIRTAEEAVKVVNSGDRVYVGTCTSVAYILGNALADRSAELEDVVIGCANIGRELRLIGNPKFKEITYFMGVKDRAAVHDGFLDYTSFHLSQLDVWCTKILRPNVLFLEVAPMDEEGNFNFGANGVVLNKYLLETAETVVVQVNENVPYVLGEYNKIHISKVDLIVEANDEVEINPGAAGIPDPGPAVSKIRDFIVDQIPDGATFQLGAGHIPACMGYALGKKNDLGVHTETIGDSIMAMMKAGVVTNRYKQLYPDKTVAGFALGSRELYDYIDRNEDFHFLPLPILNNPYVMAQNDNFISVNSCLYIDLTGQVASENINGSQYTGIGGQVDFVRGAQMSRGGKSFIACDSTFTNRGGETGSRIVFGIPEGTPVTTSRADVQYVVTEYGCVNLKELTMKERVRAMISLAHPDFRDQLRDQARERGLL